MAKSTRDTPDPQAPPWEEENYEGKHAAGIHSHAYCVSLADYHRRHEAANSPTLTPNPPPLTGFDW